MFGETFDAGAVGLALFRSCCHLDQVELTSLGELLFFRSCCLHYK